MTPAPVQRTPSAPTVRPIAAYNPIRPSVALQRDAEDDAGDGDEDDGTGAQAPWWTPAGAGAPELQSLPVSAGDAGPAVQRSAFTSPSVAPTPGAVSASHAMRGPGGAPTLVGPSLQRAARPSTATSKLPLAIPASPAAATSTSAQVGTPGTAVVFPQRSITSDPVVQTSRAPDASGAPTVQREGGTVAASTSTAASTTGAAAPVAGKSVPSERDLDELAKQLFGRIRTRLRADLLHDREAAGFTFDNV